MRTNPLQEILEQAMKLDEPLGDSEWPAADDAFLVQPTKGPRPNTAPSARPLVPAIGR